MATLADEATSCAEVAYDDTNMYFMKVDQEVQNLKEYFRRPRVIASGSLSTTRTALWNTSLNYPNLEVLFPDLAARLTGVVGFRFTTCVRVTVAATPFQQGVLCLSCQHGVDTAPDTYIRVGDPRLCTQLPHVRLDISELTAVELKVPFIYPAEYMNIGGFTSIAQVGLTQILATPTTSAAAPTYRVYMWLEDLELLGARPFSTPVVVPQSRAIPVGNTGGASHSERTSAGLVSGVLSDLGSIVGRTSNAFDLGSVGNTLQWAMASASKAAAAFGYSKPRDEKAPVRHYRSDYIGDVNVDMPSEAFSLSNFASNRLAVDRVMSGSNNDEMSLDFVGGVYGINFVGTMNTSDGAGARLYATQTCPRHMWYREVLALRPGGNFSMPLGGTATPPNVANAVAMTPVCFLAHLFRFWRGDLQFRFTFAKTKFHAGRVIVGFVPLTRDVANVTQYTGAGLQTPAVEVSGGSAQVFGYTKVFDLRDSNTFEFDVPWFTFFPHLGTNGCTGGLTMTVMDPLIANGESATSIEYMVEVRMKPGCLWSLPAANTMVPAPRDGVVYFQSAAIGPKSNPSKYTIGEEFNSLKQLVMIPSCTRQTVAAAGVLRTPIPHWSYFPRFTMAAPMPNPVRLDLALARGGIVAACYAFVQGSTVIHSYMASGSGFQVLRYHPVDAVLDNPSGANSYSPQPSLANAVISRGTLHAEIPMMSRFARLPALSLYPSTLSTRNVVLGNTANPITSYSTTSFGLTAIPVLLSRNLSAAADTRHLTFAAGDDARATTFVGIPPIIVFSAAQTLSPQLDADGDGI